MAAARRHGTVICYDLNYRPSLWTAIGGKARAARSTATWSGSSTCCWATRRTSPPPSGSRSRGWTPALSGLDPASFGRMIERVVADFPNLRVVATTLREATTATRNDWGAVCWADGTLYEAPRREDLEILDRVGGGDSFASGLVFGFLEGLGPQAAVEYGAAHGALAMTTPGDTSMATRAEVEQIMRGGGARIAR